MVSQGGIEAKPIKIKVNQEISLPKTIKEVQKLTRCVAALGRFMLNSTHKAPAQRCVVIIFGGLPCSNKHCPSRKIYKIQRLVYYVSKVYETQRQDIRRWSFP